MSTILDALRKVEEEKRTKETDVRTRLLSNSARFDFRTPRRSRFPWVVAGGLVVAGIALGTGLMLLRAPDTALVAEVVPPPTSLSQAASVPSPASPEQRRPGTRSKEEILGRQSPQVAQVTPEAGTMAPTEKPFLAVPPSSARSTQRPEPGNRWTRWKRCNSHAHPGHHPPLYAHPDLQAQSHPHPHNLSRM
jgi:hypothetical protein